MSDISDSPPDAPSADAPPDDAIRARVDAALRPFALGTAPGAAGATMTERAAAAAARDAATALGPLLGDPPRSADRIRRLVLPVLLSGWADFDATYEAALDALLALPPARPDVEEPAWDAALAPVPRQRRAWAEHGSAWTTPRDGSVTIGPGGTEGYVIRYDAKSALISADARPIRFRSRCVCEESERSARPPVPFELVHRRRDGSILDVTVGSACGVCRAKMS